jgi:hypothetical protein
MEEVFILKQVKELRKEHKRVGAEKLHRLIAPTLQKHNIKYGRNKFYILLREYGLLVRRRRRGPKTTNSKHFFRKYPNLVRDIEIMSSGRLWVSDITYIRTEKGFVLSLACYRSLFKENCWLVPVPRPYQRRGFKCPENGHLGGRSKAESNPPFRSCNKNQRLNRILQERSGRKTLPVPSARTNKERCNYLQEQKIE